MYKPPLEEAWNIKRRHSFYHWLPVFTEEVNVSSFT
jgi:hypothetical protein